jgi:thymidylate synthase (FAD)
MIEKGYTINVLDCGYVRYIDHLGSDERICEAARISYKSPSKGKDQDKRLLEYLWKHHHTSPFEQVNLTFNIKLPLFVQGQMVRHRTQRLNQVSARYTEMVDDFYIPNEWRKQDTKNKQGSVVYEDWNYNGYYEGIFSKNQYLSTKLKNHCIASYKLYKEMITDGVAREMARMILPQNLYTEIYSNWDLNNLLRFFTLRLDEHAQWEIRQYAKAMYDITKEIYPWTIGAYDKYKWKLIEEV